MLDTEVELVTLRVEAEGALPRPWWRPCHPATARRRWGGRSCIRASGSIEAPVFDRATLGAGDHIRGPAIVTQLDATTLLARGWHGEVLASGALMLSRG